METSAVVPAPIASRPAEAAVLGAAAVDWVARVDRLPPPDAIAWAASYQAYPGGSGGNIAAALARLGIAACFAGKVGGDDAGRILQEDFRAAGVLPQGLQVVPGASSASCFIAVEEGGARQVFALGGSALYEDPSELHPAWFSGVRALVLADAFPAVALAAVRYCPPGTRVISSPGGLMVSQPETWLAPLLACSPVLVVSRVEALQLSGQADPLRAAACLLEKGYPLVLETLGREGVLVAAEDRFCRISPSQPVQAVDSTGAGDAFTAGFTAGLLEGLSWEQAAAAGIRVAGAKVSHPGARAGIPDRSEYIRLNREVSIQFDEVKP